MSAASRAFIVLLASDQYRHCRRKVIFVDTDALGVALERKTGPLIENDTEARLIQRVS